MKKSYLIQRLKQPIGQSICSFGCGLKNGGLDRKSMAIINKICLVDYMGSSEFEWGAFPDALIKMQESKSDLICGSFKTHYKFYNYGFGENPSKDFEGNKRVYYLCTKEQEKEVKTRISKWAMAEPYEKTMERVALDQGMAMGNDDGRNLCGWLELDNGFMFFTDETMWRNFCTVYDVKTPSKKKVKKQK